MAQVIGERVTRAERHDALKLPARYKKNKPFLYMSHPLCFEFDEATGDWLPQLSKMYLDPGVCGVADNGDISLAVAGATQRGWQIVQPSDGRLGEFVNYSQKLPHSAGGFSYEPIFKNIDIEAGKVFTTPRTEDFKAFRKHLVKSGVVPACTDNIKKLKTREQRALCERLEGRQANSPNNAALARRAAKAQALLAAMEGKPKARKPGRPKKVQATDES